MSAALLGTGGGGGFWLPISGFCPVSRVFEPEPNPKPVIGALLFEDKLSYLFVISYL